MVKLSDYQIDAVTRLKTGSILCGGVGSGKSRTALAYYMFDVCHGIVPLNGMDDYVPMQDPMDLYIITTARKRDTLEWERECLPFLLYDPDQEFCKVRVIVDSWNKIQQYIDVKNCFFIFDEQRVIGYGAWVKAFLKIVKHNRWILLTATPGDNWMDYIPIFIANGFYRNKTQFINEHVVFSRFAKYPKVERFLGIPKLIRLKDSILVNMDYQKKTVMHHINLEVGYDRGNYRDALNDRWDIFKDEPCIDASSMCYVLRRIVNESKERRDQIAELINNIPKLIIFYNFDYELELLRDICKNTCRTPYSEWNGHKHEPIKLNEEYWVYLVQYTAGAEGWNCIETNSVAFYSPSYSYKTTVQAAGRIDRLNTPYTDLYCYHLLSNSTIDKAIWKCLEDKKNFNEKIFMPMNSAKTN